MEPATAGSRRNRLLVVAGLATYFLYFNWDRVRMPLAADDWTNLCSSFEPGIGAAVAAQLLLWADVFRPMGAAFYLPVYLLFGLNPAGTRLRWLCSSPSTAC